MVDVIHTTLEVGLEKPVKILHITDVHLTKFSENDPADQQALLTRRYQTFRREGEEPPLDPEGYFAEAIQMAEALGSTLVVTGDVMDLFSEGNVRAFHSIADGHDMMFSPGGHETQRICRRTMEEPYPYWVEMRERLAKAFPEFDLDFESRIVGGLNIITANNALDFYNAYTLECFKRELERGLPIVVFSHDPLTDGLLNRTEPHHPNVTLTPEDYRVSHEMIDLLRTHPLVKGVFGGHWHGRRDEVLPNGRLSFCTPGLFKGICRLIEAK